MAAADFDVIVVGLGPAGGHCSRLLARAGLKVLMADRSKDFYANNFSSAGAPLEIMSTYALPPNVVGAHWKSVNIASSRNAVRWHSQSHRGVVLDFAALRTFLFNEAMAHGAEGHLSHSYQSHEVVDGHVDVTFKNLVSHSTKRYSAKIVVDATGADRALLNPSFSKGNGHFPATGIEQLIEVPEALWNKYSETLSFFLGREWMPQGYAWVFPMQERRLKVGVARYFTNEKIVAQERSYSYYLEAMKSRCFAGAVPKVLDKHGKTLYYAYGRRDRHRAALSLAIGDAVSTVNPLAGEGIRHAMLSATIAAEQLQSWLAGDSSALARYEKKLNQYTRWRWCLSEFVMKRLYRQSDDRRLDDVVEAFKSLTFDELMGFAFDYAWKPTAHLYFNYLWQQLPLINSMQLKTRG